MTETYERVEHIFPVARMTVAEVLRTVREEVYPGARTIEVGYREEADKSAWRSPDAWHLSPFQEEWEEEADLGELLPLSAAFRLIRSEGITKPATLDLYVYGSEELLGNVDLRRTERDGPWELALTSFRRAGR